MRTPLIALFALLPLAACTSTQEARTMPVQILTAAPANAQAYRGMENFFAQLNHAAHLCRAAGNHDA